MSLTYSSRIVFSQMQCHRVRISFQLSQILKIHDSLLAFTLESPSCLSLLNPIEVPFQSDEGVVWSVEENNDWDEIDLSEVSFPWGKQAGCEEGKSFGEDIENAS